MPAIEADTAIVYGRVVENFRVSSPVDAYFDLVVVPGFSDAHAHPQVIDAGVRPGLRWRHSYEWLARRSLVVDEASLRADLELSARLAELALKRAVLEGTTLVALTGRLEANVAAWRRLQARPRTVFMPTIMDRGGWPSLWSVKGLIEHIEGVLEDGLARLGLFVHSIGMVSRATLVSAFKYAAHRGMPLGIHLGEGRRESHLLRALVGLVVEGVKLIPVHCIEDDPPTPSSACVSCPVSNLLLYGRTRRKLAGVLAFGSDWPHLVGTVASHLPIILRVHRGMVEEVFRRLTVGGYVAYGLPWKGDLVAFDAKLSRLSETFEPPRLVLVSWRPVVVEGEVQWTGERLVDVVRETREAVREAIDLYSTGDPGGVDPIEATRRAYEALIAASSMARPISG